ncbi:Cadherin-13, partial [Chelonia mydas]
GSTVMRMMAFDADDPGTDNALLRYNILKQTPDKPSPNMFFIDPEKGDIVTVVSPALLDRESLPGSKLAHLPIMPPGTFVVIQHYTTSSHPEPGFTFIRGTWEPDCNPIHRQRLVIALEN